MVIHLQQKTKITTLIVVTVLCSIKELGGTNTVITATLMVSIITDITLVTTVLSGISGKEIQLKELK